MPTFTIQVGDGRKVTMESPDETTALHDADAWAVSNPKSTDPLRGKPYQDSQAQIAAQRAKGGFGLALQNLSGAAQQMINGVPFLPDVQAGLQTLVDPSTYTSGRSPLDSYKAERQYVRAEGDSFSAAHPIASNLSNSAGTAATMFIPGVGEEVAGSRLASTAPLAAKAINAARIAGRGALAAGTTGAVYGLGSDGTAQQRIQQGARGAALGAALGAPLAGIAGVLGSAPAKTAKVSTSDTLDALQAEKTAAYKKVDDLGVRYTPEAVDQFIQGSQDEMRAASINALRHPKAASMLQDIQALKGQSPTLTQMDQLRQVIRRDVANSSDGSERFLGQKLIANLDDFINSTSPASVSSGNATEGAAAINKARDLNTRFMKVQAVNDAVDSAALRAGSTGSGGNADNATRQNLRRVLEKTGNLSEDETGALTDAVVGDPLQNALRQVGKLSPHGNGLMLAGQLAAAVPTHGLSGVSAIAGAAAKAAADALTRQKVEQLVRLMAAGGSNSAQAVQQLQSLSAQSPDVSAALAKALQGVGAVSGHAMSAQ